MFGIGNFIAPLAVLGICVFAMIRGRTPERWTGVAILSTLPIGLLVRTAPPSLVPTLSLVADGLYAFLFLALVLFYASLWLGAVMCLYAAQFALHAYYFVSQREPDLLHAVVNNGIFLGVAFCLLLGTLSARSRPAT